MLLFTQGPIFVWFDSTIIDISTILLTMYYKLGWYRQTNFFFFLIVPDLPDGKSVEPMKFREPVPILLKNKEEKNASNSSQ